MSSAISRPSLVLNRQWQPVGVTQVSRALLLLWQDHARVVDPDDYQQYNWDEWLLFEPAPGEPCVRTVRQAIRAPEIVALLHYDRVPNAAVVFSRRNVQKRDRFTCQYCGRQTCSEDLTIDHVLPRARGGETTWENCVAACVKCNRSKADRTPEQAGLRLRKRPTRPMWSPWYATQSSRLKSWKNFVRSGQDLATVEV